MSFPPDQDPLEKYFSKYPTFNYDSRKPATSEFYRMCNWFDWDREDGVRQEAHESFKDAVTKKFNLRFGTDANSLASWQLLCDRLQVSPIPDTLKECRKVSPFMSSVNLIDLVGNGVARSFSTVEQLSTGELLRYLLRHILDPSKDSGRNGVRGRGHGRGRGSGRGSGSGRGRGSGRTRAKKRRGSRGAV